MSTPKRHHYLPQFYLEGFCRDGYLWVFDSENEEYRRQTPKNTAVEKDFYTVVNKDGEKNNEIEKILSNVESWAKPVIHKIEAREPLSQDDRDLLSLFISFIKHRVPDFENFVNEFYEKTIKRVCQIMYSSEDNTRQILSKFEEETGEKLDGDPQDFMEFVKRDNYTLKMNRQLTLASMLNQSPDFANYLRQMEWVFTCAPENTSYVTTDNPFLLLPPEDYNPNNPYGVGILTPGAKKIVPLTKNTCLWMYERGDSTTYADVTEKDVDMINLVIASSCDRFLIGQDKSQVENLVEIVHLPLKNKVERIKVY
ncbi:MAG: DUF4238 domain-containing protein [Candidatus Dadabacteria bacterium]|nr:DUF4238 domain-containing protein [Candidatus Dadabacteria bacterium]